MYRFVSLIFILFLLLQTATAQVDHSEMVDGPFDAPQEVTATCLACHEDAGSDVMQDIHWTWLKKGVTVPGHKGSYDVGKKNVFNNFCIHIESNWPRCTSCHIGYGWQDSSFDFEKEENIDCLVCHDRSGTYKKSPTGAGMPDSTVNLVKVAQSVGPPSRANCGTCHFYGGGGENVKHGDLDMGLIRPERSYDVHMGGAGFTCQDCHITENHQIKGASMAANAGAQNRILCTDCHGVEAHESRVLNHHVQKIACQTCHIPTFAKQRPTKMYWDWSTAGKDSTAPKDENGLPTYDKKKGSFSWARDVQPEYAWYNGRSKRYLKGDTFNPAKTVMLNQPLGSATDDDAKLYPFKIHRGKQIYDTKNKYLIVPKLFKGYWSHFDWDKAAREGMQAAGLKYSGSYGFVNTEMYWKINHMVVPAENALHCNDCHGKGPDARMNWKELGYKGDQMYPKNRN